MSSSEDEESVPHESTPFMISTQDRKVLPINPEDCFDIEDFTNASDWEKFVSLLEEDIIGGFRSSPEDPSLSTRFLKFAGIEFKFVRYYKPLDVEDFIGFHPIQYFYGLKDFVVVSAQGGEDIDNESKIKWLMSSLSLGLPQLPFFIQCYDKRRLFFEGVSFSKDFRIDYEMLQLRKWPSSLNNLSGLVKLFKEKLNNSKGVEVRVSARCSFILKDWLHRSWSQIPSEDGNLPFGSCKDSLKSLQLNTTWKDVPEDLITDNEIHTDLTPEEAPFWSIRLYQEEQPDLILNDYLQRAQVLTKNVDSYSSLLGDLIHDNSPLDHVPNALSRITGPTYSLTDIIQSGKSKDNISEPLTKAELSAFMSFLFPDLLGDKFTSFSGASPYPEEILPFLELKEEMYQSYKLLMARVKSSPIHGIVWRLSILLNNVYYGAGGLKGAAHLLHVFMSRIRMLWETGRPIPGVAPGPPDHSYCLFHQKLQMINSCILKRRDFEGQMVGDGVQVVELNDDEEEDDEFFDCNEEDETDRSLPVWNRKPEGRLKRFGKEKLLEYDDFLYVPVCQDPAPMTEDQLAEKAAIMFHLGFDEEGSNLRAKMQSTSLLSDMEAFKAANPGSVLGDFIRWHSPRDWHAETNDISPRMKNEGNIWLQNWEIAKPVPVKRQKRLFDYTIEAEKALNYLSNLNPGEVASQLLPNIIHAGVCRLISEEFGQDVPHVQDILNEAIQKLATASRLQCPSEIQHFQSVTDGETQKIFDKRVTLCHSVVQILSLAELKLSTFLSIKAKFIPKDVGDNNDVYQNFANSLYNSTQNEIDVDGGSMGPCGTLISSMFEDAQRNELMNFDPNSKVNKFPKAYSKEFILRTNAPKPHSFSKAGPQKLTCLLKADELKIAGSFSTHLAYS